MIIYLIKPSGLSNHFNWNFPDFTSIEIVHWV